MPRSSSAGFTMIEIVLVLVVMGLLTVAVYPFLRTSTGQAELKRALWEVTDNVRRAQVQSMAGEEDSVWGIHFDTTSYVLFKGATYNSGDTTNITFDLPAQITIGPVTLTGGGSDLVFERTTGKTSSSGTVQINDASSGSNKTITITSEGKLTTN